MTYTQAKAELAINDYLETNFTALHLAFPNIPYRPSETEAYVRVTHRPGQKRQASLGTDGLNRISGVLFLYVSYPVGVTTGSYDPNLSAEYLVALFEHGAHITKDGVTVITERSQRTGVLEGDTRYTPVVEVGWYAYVQKDTVS